MNYTDPDNVPSEWQVGDVILDKYEVKEVFESGGMGLVYRAYHREWDMDLAVKSPRSHLFQTAEQIASFESEAETWVNLGLHPHIVSCYYVRRLGGIPRIYAEFVEGGTLSDWIRSGRLYVGGPKVTKIRVLDIAIQTAWGLHFAHEKGLVHQDVKPANVLMMPDGTAKVSDFGLASARQSVREGTTTERKPGQSILVQGSGFLTPEYASPEQFAGQSLSKASDVWSWAVLLLEMVKGECDWSDGRAAPFVLEEFYGDQIATDGLACILRQCFVVPVHQRSSSLLEHAIALTALYETLARRPYPRSYRDETQASSDALNNRGASLLDLGRTESGLACIKDSLNVNPRNLHAKFNSLVMSWRLGKSTDEDIIEELSAFRDDKNSAVVDDMLDHICAESGVPVKARSIRLQRLPANAFRLNFLCHQPVRLAAIRLIISQTGDTQLMSVSKSGYVKITTTAGHELISFDILLDGGDWMQHCAITSDGRWVVFSQEKALSESNQKTIKHGKREIPIETRIYVVDVIHQAITKTAIAHQGGASCFRLINDHELATGGKKDCSVRIWRIPELLPIARLDLSHPATASKLAGKVPFGPNYNHHEVKVAAKDVIELSNTGILAITHGVCRGPRLWKRPGPIRNAPVVASSLTAKLRVLLSIPPKFPMWQSLGVLPQLINCIGPSPMALSQDGCLIAAGYPIHIWSSEGHLEVTLPSVSYAGKYAFSSDSQFIVAGELGGFALWHVPSGRKLSTINLDNYECAVWDCLWYDNIVTIFGSETNGNVFGLTLSLPHLSSFLSLAQPTSFSETHDRNELIKAQFLLAEQALEEGRFTQSLKLVRETQLQNDSLTDQSLREIEERICAFGTPVELQSGILELHLQEQAPKGCFFVNSTGTQSLWLADRDPGGFGNEETRHAVLFNTKSGEVIESGRLVGDRLDMEDAEDIWQIKHGLNITIIDCNRKAATNSLQLGAWKRFHRASVTPDGSRFICRNDTTQDIELWDLKCNQLISTMPLCERWDSQACISDDAAWTVVLIRKCEQQKTMLAQYSCRNWRLMGTFLEDVDGYVSSIALCDCNSKIIISRSKGDSERSEVELWDVVQKKYLRSCGRGGGLVIAPDCYPYVFVGRHDGTVAVINCTLGKEMFSIPTGGDSVESMTLSHDKLRLIVNGRRVIHLFWSYHFSCERDDTNHDPNAAR
jgi:serine/threonine protein kinase